MAYTANGVTVIDDSRKLTVDGYALTVLANTRTSVGVFANNTTFTTPTAFQGTVAGFNSGGYGIGSGTLKIIDTFPFATDTNSVVFGNVIDPLGYGATGQSSTTSGYNSGGVWSRHISKFPFAYGLDSTSVGQLTSERGVGGGQSSTTHGYMSGGQNGPTNPSSPNGSLTIDKFPFSADTNATNIGSLTQRRGGTGQSSTTHGYTTGGRSNYPSDVPTFVSVNTIDKFPFSTDTNATDVGDITYTNTSGIAGLSSTTHGYSAGGYGPPGPGSSNIIDKFPFSSDTNATDVGDLTASRYGMGPQSSVSFGYLGGGTPGSVSQNQKFPFASDTNASNVGNLITARYFIAGQQD